MTINQFDAGAAMPRSLKFAVGGLVFQALMNGLLGVLLIGLASSEADHGRDEGTGLLQFVGVVSVVLAVVLAVCAVLVGRRFGWVRVTVITIEGVSIASAVLALFNGSVPGVLGIVIAAGIIRSFVSPEGRAWFSA